MRISNNFGERLIASESKEPVSYYFLVCEGEKTEVDYFNGVKANSESLNISNRIRIEVVDNHVCENHMSHPLKIIEEIEKDIINGNHLTLSKIINLINDYYVEKLGGNKDIGKKIVEKAIREIFNGYNLYKEIDFVESKIKINDVLKLVSRSISIFKHNIEVIIDYIKNYKIEYNNEIDKICLIIDRDKKSFVSNKNVDQYNEVKVKCKEMNIDLFVTNPCFEFWLYLHLDNALSLNKKDIINNEIKNEKTFIFNELKKKLPNYKKNKLNFEDFKDNIDYAIDNIEEYYTSNIESLKNSCGSNLGELFKLLRQK